MAGINLIISNKLEILADKLSETVKQPAGSPMTPEIIIVQSSAMTKWISMGLSTRLGIWSNCRYMFPNEFIQELFGRLAPGMDHSRYLDRDIVAWKIINHLPSHLDDPCFEGIKKYLSGNLNEIKTFQLSYILADLYDQYLTYRPDMIIEWDKSGSSEWQGILWKAVSRDMKRLHPPALKKKFFEEIKKEGHLLMEGLPARISLFGISYLPPFHLEMIFALSVIMEINLFFTSPTREYWADIKTGREISKEIRKNKKGRQKNDDLHLYKGNSILASMGKMGRDFFGNIMKSDIEPEYFFEDYRGCGMLHAIQKDILSMIDRGAGNDLFGEKIEMTEEAVMNDDSILINSCHSPLREVEVLQNFLLRSFSSDQSLRPVDIIVMCPDIELFAPFINAVFLSPENESMRIPFAVAGRQAIKDNGITEAFFSILEIFDNRFAVSSLLKILECRDVLSAFDILPGDLHLINRWVREANIRWGYNGRFKQEFGLPPAGENTWEAGFDRLILGFSMMEDGMKLFNDMAPCGGIEGGDSRILGRFINFFNTLAAEATGLKERKPLNSWMENLRRIVDTFFSGEQEPENGVSILYTAIDKLGLIKEKSEFTGETGLDIIKIFLINTLQESGRREKFFTGGVTFCSMIPLQAIPFRIICMIGMNDGIFPRSDRNMEFDLIAAARRAGDRSYREEDRYLFLEIILSAGDKVFITYTGQSVHDNSKIQPSTVINELTDYLDQAIAFDGRNLKDMITIIHPLQPHSSKYFDSTGSLYSYSEVNCRAAEKLSDSGRVNRRFIKAGMIYNEDIPEKISLDRFLKFFNNPIKDYFNNILKVRLDEPVGADNDVEPFVISGLERFLLQKRICEMVLKEISIEGYYNVLKSMGCLPHGRTGEALYNVIVRDSIKLAGEVKKNGGSGKCGDIEVKIRLPRLSITGVLGDIWDGGLIQYKPGKTRARDRLRSWILHLVLNLMEGKHPRKSLLLCEDGKWEMPDIVEPGICLESLAGIFLEGNARPLPFFPETSFCYADEKISGKGEDFIMEKCHDVWRGNFVAPGESSDIYIHKSYKYEPPLGDEFKSLALKIFRPMLDHQKRGI